MSMAKWKITFNPDITMDITLVELITRIKSYIEILKDIPIGQGQKEDLLTENFRPSSVESGTLKDEIILKDIKGTAAIEGNVLNDKEINKVLKSEQTNNIQEKEILNLKKVRLYIEQIAPMEEKVLITEELIKNLNKEVMQGVTLDEFEEGTYRKYNVLVGKNYSPTRFEDIPKLMKEFVDFINSEEILNYDPLIRAVLAHFYLVTIHPFGNGNGRTSRALEAYLFYNAGLSVHGFYSLNNYYYKNYEEYFSILDESRFKYKGNLQMFVVFALKGYCDELNKILIKVKSFVIRISYVSYVKELFNYGDITSRQYSLLEWIKYNNGVYTKTQIINSEEQLIKVLYQGIKTTKTRGRDINNLLKNNLIATNTDNKIILNYDVMKQFTK